jgi:hypothetical protein
VGGQRIRRGKKMTDKNTENAAKRVRKTDKVEKKK